MSRTVLFIGGPLHGKTWLVDAKMPFVYAYDPKSTPNLDDPLPEPVAYNLARFAFCGRVIWVGHLGSKPDEDMAFDLLASDAAKSAVSISETEEDTIRDMMAEAQENPGKVITR